jgi:hypothetical protein
MAHPAEVHENNTERVRGGRRISQDPPNRPRVERIEKEVEVRVQSVNELETGVQWNPSKGHAYMTLTGKMEHGELCVSIDKPQMTTAKFAAADLIEALQQIKRAF